MKKPIYVLVAIAVVVALIYYTSGVPEQNPPSDVSKLENTLVKDSKITEMLKKNTMKKGMI